MKIAQEITYAFGVEVNKDVVRRILEKHYDPSLNDDGPSWLTTIGHIKDSLWSMDLFRCESILLQSFWVMVVIDVFTRRFIGFAVERGNIDGVAVCRMFNCAISKQSLPKYLSTDNDPLFRISSMARHLKDPRYRRDQDSSISALLASLRRKSNPNGPGRAARSSAILEPA